MFGLASGMWNILTFGYGSVAASAAPPVSNEEENMMLKGNKFAILATEKEKMTKDFTRRV